MPPDAPRSQIEFVPPGRRGVRGALVIVLGVLAAVVGLAIVLVPVKLEAGWPLRVVGICVGSFLMSLAVPTVRIGRRFRVAPGDWDALAQDPRPPIVYLRPFDVDGAELVTFRTGHVRMRLVRRMVETTYEQRLARTLARIGPLVAIADPTDALLEMGARRLRAADGEWQERVAELTARAGSIIVHAGASDGLAWEIAHVVALGTPERVIVALPLEAAAWQPSKQQRYGDFARRCWTIFPRGLPDEIGESTFLYFDSDWRPHRFGHRGASVPAPSHPSGAPRSLVLARLGSEFKVMLFPFWARATFAIGCAIYVLIALAVLIVIALE